MSPSEKQTAARVPGSDAETFVGESGGAAHETMPPEVMWQTLHALRARQIELELQNEKLCRAHVAMEASRERYLDLYDLAPVGYLTMNQRGVVLDANLTAGTLLGLSREELVKQSIYRFIVKDDHIVYHLHRKRIFETGDPLACELRMVRQGGTTFWARMEASIVREESGDSVFRVVISDITDRKQAGARLQLAACVFSHAREGIMITAADGTIAEVNRAFTRITGYSRDEALGRNSRFLASDRQNQAFYAAVWRALIKDGYWSGEVWNRRKDGELYVEMQTISAVPDVQGNVQQLVTLFSDITAIKRAEEALAASEELRRLFIEYAPAGLAMFDREMRYLYTSKHWFADHGLDQLDLYGLSHYDVFPEIPEQWKEFHRRGLAGEVLRSEGDRFERLDGSVKWMRWEIRPWYNGQGSIGGIIIFTEDITVNKKAEEALRESEERLSLLLRGVQDGFWDWNMVRNEAYYSPRWWNMLGYADGELDAAPDLWRRLMHPDDLEHVNSVFTTELAGGRDSYEVEFRLLHKDGHYLNIISSVNILRDEQGKAKRVSGSNRISLQAGVCSQ